MRSHTAAVCRIAFEHRRKDARFQCERALARAIRDDQQDLACELSELLDRYRHRRLREDDAGPTPETVVKARLRRDPIEALVRSRKLDQGHAAKADEIARVFEELTKRLGCKGAAMERGYAPGWNRQWEAMSTHMSVIYRFHYRPWCRWMTDCGTVFRYCSGCGRTMRPKQAPCCAGAHMSVDKPRLSLVLAVAVWRRSIEDVAAEQGIGTKRCVRLLRLGLDQYRP
jgi:hypothetical protein